MLDRIGTASARFHYLTQPVTEPLDLDLPTGRTRIGVSVCEDLWDDYYTVKPLRELAAKGANVLFNINASNLNAQLYKKWFGSDPRFPVNPQF